VLSDQTLFIVIASSARVGSYGHSWMRDAIKSRVASDAVGRSARQELQDYLTTPLEDVEDVVAWWGVGIKFALKSIFLLTFGLICPPSITVFNIPSY